MKRLLIILFLFVYNSVFGQGVAGVVINAESRVPVEFVNIGIVGKNVGTVSDVKGRFSFFVDPKYDNDTVIFSIIGYKPQLIKVSALRKGGDNLVLLEERAYEMNEVVVRPRVFKERTLGVTTKFKKISAGFKDNMLGYECGILMKVKKSAFLKRVNINISNCSYDTIFYRVNIYKVHGKMDFENILREPVYLKMPKKSVGEGIVIDLAAKNIVVDGDFLVTLEHVKDLGPGNLYFCAGLSSKTYFRKTSQGKWETVPVGVSISVVADVEK